MKKILQSFFLAPAIAMHLTLSSVLPLHLYALDTQLMLIRNTHNKAEPGIRVSALAQVKVSGELRRIRIVPTADEEDGRSVMPTAQKCAPSVKR